MAETEAKTKQAEPNEATKRETAKKAAAEEGQKKQRGAKNQKSGQKPQNVQIDYSWSPADIVEWAQKDNVVLFWDHTKLPELDESVVEQLPYKAKQGYFMAKGMAQKIEEDEQAEAEEAEAAKSPMERLSMLSGLNSRPGARMKKLLRPRKGWYQTWKRPDEVEQAKELGYRHIRENKGGEEPGEESGRVVTFGRLPSGDRELYAMEIPEEEVRNLEKSMAAKSQIRFQDQKKVLADFMNEVNGPKRSKGEKITLVDNSAREAIDREEIRGV